MKADFPWMPQIITSKFIVLILLVAITGILSGCAEKKSADELFKQALTHLEESAQRRDVDAFMEHVSQNYQDSQGRTWNEIRRIAQIHFLRNSKLHIYKHVTQLSVIDEASAEAIILVAIAGQPIETAESLANMRAELIQFNVKFLFDKKWLATSADWKRAGAKDFL